MDLSGGGSFINKGKGQNNSYRTSLAEKALRRGKGEAFSYRNTFLVHGVLAQTGFTPFDHRHDYDRKDPPPPNITKIPRTPLTFVGMPRKCRYIHIHAYVRTHKRTGRHTREHTQTRTHARAHTTPRACTGINFGPPSTLNSFVANANNDRY